MALHSSLAVLVPPSSENSPSIEVVDLTTCERTRFLTKDEKSDKRRYVELLDTTLNHDEEKQLWENQERDSRANFRAEKRLMIEHLRIAEQTNNDIRSKNAVLASRNQKLERKLTMCSAENTELKKELQESLRETSKVRRSLEHYSNKHRCPICITAEADRLTQFGHLFCQECLDNWEDKWYRENDHDGDMHGALKGILTCPICREWVVMLTVKHMYRS